MSHCIILLKTLILFVLISLLNCGDFIKTFDIEKSYFYDENKNTETENYQSQTVDNAIGDKTTGVEDYISDENNIKVVCPYFKKSGEINLEHMIGVWRPAYYQVAFKVPCFKMLIRNISAQERNQYSQRYGDFNSKVIWDDCHLEIKSSANLVYRKHFLQGCEKGSGVLENIIIEQKGNAVPILVEETADQWLAINNLLLMRDCMTGDIVIFSSSESYQPKLYDILEATEKFGNISSGKWACNDGGKPGPVRPIPFNAEYESDNDLMIFE